MKISMRCLKRLGYFYNNIRDIAQNVIVIRLCLLTLAVGNNSIITDVGIPVSKQGSVGSLSLVICTCRLNHHNCMLNEIPQLNEDLHGVSLCEYGSR